MPIYFSFQRTYEELKHQITTAEYIPYNVFSVPMRNWNNGSKCVKRCLFRSFQRTYEELKLVERSEWIKRDEGFQRTYEELKPCTPPGRSSGTGVFSVPMRNWNSQNQRGNPSGRKFSAYLWGIETRRRNLRPRQQYLRFQRTYEELKRGDKNAVRHVLYKFSAYLWGIETAPAKSVQEQ